MTTTIQLHDRGMIALMYEALFNYEMDALAKWENAEVEDADRLEEIYDQICQFHYDICRQVERNLEER